jgi:CubicO group peptidase (beta-lactamase class C family)
MKTARLLRLSSIFLFLVACPVIPVVAQDAARLDEVVQAYVPDRFMGSVLVVRDDEVVLDRSYGFANLEWNIPNTPDTKFRLGSITKQFTAAAILLLEDQGKLKTSDLLSAHLPNTPEAWKDITLHHLLSHEAGLPNVTSLPWFAQNMMKPIAAQATIAAFHDLPLDFAPGSEFRYSNSGFIVLGRLVELISGVSYADFVRDNIFMPLGMTSSGYDSNTQVIPNRASGYSPGPNGPMNAGYVDMLVPHGAGALYSTTGDLLRWNQGLFGGELLSTESLAKMTTPNLGDYAYGVIVTTAHDAKRVSHNGSIQGFNTAMTYYPDEKLLVVALSNINGPGADTIVAHLDNIMHGETVVLPGERQQISLADDILQQFVGTYPLAPNVAMSVTVENGQLIMQPTGQRKLPVFAETETRFFAKAVEATIEFQKDATGAVTALTLNQGGRSMTGPKQALIPPPAFPEEISVAEDILAKYVGSYALAPNFILAVTLENGQLMTQATGQAKVPVYAESETKFFLKAMPASIEFQLDAAGAVTGVVLNQGGRSMPAPRQ